MSATIEIDGHSVDVATKHFRFDAFHEIVDAGELTKLRLLPALVSASFGGTNLDDTGLAHVCAVTTISNLDLQETQISDHGLKQLQSLPQLEHLRLKGNRQLTDKCTVHLSGLHSLVDLQIHETSIEQVGLNTLESMQGLTDICISVWNGNYTYTELVALSTRMPNCTILAKGQGEFFAGQFDGQWSG